MRTKVTLILLFLNVALFFFIFKFERQWRTDSAALEARRRVLGPETANIQSIQIASSGPGPTIELVKRGTGWELTAPVRWPANPHAVTRIINDLALLEHDHSFKVEDLEKNGMSLADYGLDDPRLTVSFSSSSQAGDLASGATDRVVLRLGRETPADKRLYVLSPDGQRVHVVGRSLADSLAQTVEELRSPEIFTIQVFELRALILRTVAALRVRVRQDNNRWLLEAPVQARANRARSVLAINGLRQLRVHRFIEQRPTAGAPDPNTSPRITLEGNNRSETLFLGAPVGAAAQPASQEVEYYGMIDGNPELFTVVVPAALLETLNHAQKELRERRLLEFDPRAVTAITIGGLTPPEVTLQRLESPAPAGDAAPWQLVRRDATQGPQTQPADAPIVHRLLEQLTEVAADEFISDAPSRTDLENWGFNRPERTITLTLAPPATPTTRPGEPTLVSQLTLLVGVGTERGPTAYARVVGSESIYTIDAEILRQIPPRPLHYRARLIRELPASAEIKHLKLADLDHHTAVVETTLPNPPEDAALQPLLTELKSLRAKAFAADTFSVASATESWPWKYRLDLTYTVAGGAAGVQAHTLTLFFSERSGGTTQFAGSPELSTVWELEQPFIDALWAITYRSRDPGPTNLGDDLEP